MTTPVIERRAARQAATDDWLLLIDPSRPNGLVIGSDAAIAARLRSLDTLLARPLFRWPVDGSPWGSHGAFRTLVLDHVDMLGAREQAKLLAWMDGGGCDVQVISLARVALYPLVQRGLFLEALYYRLNVVYLPLNRD